MMKKIILFDEAPVEKWERDLMKAAKAQSIQIESCSIKKSILLLDQNARLSLFCQNKLVDWHNGYWLARKIRLQDRKFFSLLCEYADIHHIPYDDHYRKQYREFDKCQEMVILSQQGIPYLPSIVGTRMSLSENWSTVLANISFPVVVKSNGNKGEAVWKVDDEKGMKAKCDELPGLIMIQQYLPNSYDIRIGLYRDSVLWAVKRSATDGFYNNLSRGGCGEITTISEYEMSIAIKAASLMDIDLAGVDLVRSENSVYIFEVNSTPSIDQFSDLANINVGELVLEKLSALKYLQ